MEVPEWHEDFEWVQDLGGCLCRVKGGQGEQGAWAGNGSGRICSERRQLTGRQMAWL